MGGSQFSIFGTVGLDTSGATAGAKQVRSEIENLAKSGIAGFEAAQQKVIEFTKRVAELRNALLQTTDPARQKELNLQLDAATARMTAARTEVKGMSLEAHETAQKVQFLAASLGVQVPQGMANILAKIPALQAGMEAAFSASLVVGFGAAIVSQFPRIAEWIDNLRGVVKVNEEILAKQIEVNNALAFGGEQGGAEALEKRLNGVANEIDRIKKSLKSVGVELAVPYGMPLMKQTKLTRDEMKSLNEDLARLRKSYEELQFAIPLAEQKAMNEANREAAEVAKKAAQAVREQAEADREWMRGLGQMYLGNQDELDKQIANTKKAQADVNAAIQKGHEDADTEAIRFWESQSEKATRGAGHITEELKKQQHEAIKTQEAQRQMVEATAGKIESFIDRVFLTARSLGDVFHQFLMQILGSFVKWASRMAAEALLGMRGMTSGGGGGGGILGSILGIGGTALSPALSYAGGGAVTGIEAAFTGPLTAGTITEIGRAGSAIPTAVGGASSGVLGKLAFGGITSASQLGLMANAGMILGGGALLGSAGGPITGAIGGGLLAAGGISTAAMLFPALAAIPGVGWIAAGILAAAMGLGALFGAGKRGQQKRDAAREQDEIAAAARQVMEEYKLHKADYEATVQTLQTMLGNAQQSLPGRYDGPGRRAADYLTTAFGDYIRQVNDLERQRQAVTTALSGFSIPEFAIGGAVSPWGFRMANGGIVAIVHPGEFIMRREAVSSLGTDFLAALNRAPRFDAGGSVGGAVQPLRSLTLTQYITQAKGENQRVFINRVVKAIRTATMDGAL
jgi:hypothetical protein